MIEWVKKFFGQSTSSATAKERLRLVLMTDHLSLAPDMIDQMKRDLVEVISRYVEVDREKVEVNFEREDRALAMLANIPIRAVNRGGGDGGGNAKTEEPKAPLESTAAPAVEPEEVKAETSDASDAAEPVAAEITTASSKGAPKPRKRRRKSGAPKPATAH